ncbi:hypothetical protein FB567DRAFT_525999 [Paraphoma chrysanthemicola]|uniref:Uncharacterized protein n=1 Tax=Paraphoma chrysanthemicola TaxID=798071 RepID=A0A8K0VXG2_9PLEO|nr:hypothetical protein FB567DRAFT_525999 [Paraphoma chrysanthemicola]
MKMASNIPIVTVDDLCAFHAKHFPHAPIPANFLHGVEQGAAEEAYEEEDDGLGYYPDGTKRTLTDEQIAMFRHSEIQAILRKRRQRREEGELSEEGEAEPEPPRDSAKPSTAPIDKVQSGRVEKLKTQQWATSSPRTKARNKRHRDNYRAKKQMMRREKERAQKTRRDEDEDEESDEWDPWHQAKGPDVQKDDTQELDY